MLAAVHENLSVRVNDRLVQDEHERRLNVFLHEAPRIWRARASGRGLSGNVEAVQPELERDFVYEFEAAVP
jgi:hypothetical protein